MLLAAGAAFAAAQGRSPERPPSARTGYVQRPESELLLLDLRLGPIVLVEGLPAFPAGGGGVLLPLGEVCRAVDFAITVDVTKGSADGFFLSESRRFTLDATTGKVLVEGQPRRFDASLVEIHQDDIYVDSRLLSEWLPIDFTVDLYGAVVNLRPREPLPVQKRQEREGRVQKGLANLGYAGPAYPRIQNPYHLLDYPFIDQTLRYNLKTSDSGSQHNVQYSTFATGDLLLHEANLYVSGDDKGISESRFSLARRDPSADLLGPLRAREYALGDILNPGLDLVSLPRSGRGITVSNYPLARQNQFDRHTFRGDLPRGWEVELYQNGALIAFAQSRPDGLYEFANVPLLFGLNLFRLVFYGPQGQRREESHRFNIAESLTPPGTLYYRAVANDPKDAGQRGHLELDYGLSKHLTSTLALASVELDSVRHSYGRLGLSGFWTLVFADAEVVFDRGGGSVASAGLQTRVGALGITLRRSQLNDFESEIFRNQYGAITSRSSVRFDATVPAPLFSQIPVAIDFSEDRLKSGQSVDRVTGRLSAFYRGFSLTNGIDWSFSRGSPRPFESSAVGDLLISKFVRSYGLRGELVYTLAPTRELTNALATVETLLFPQFFVQAGVGRAFSARQTRFLLSVTRTEGPFGFGANLDYTRPGGLSVALTLNASVLRDPRSGRWHSQARSLAGLGAASPLVFLDANGNGVRDPGEKAMDGVGFLANRAGGAQRTDAQGTALLTGLPVYQDVDVGVSTATLDDPLAIPLRPGVRFVPRPGRVTSMEVPVLISGEITGTARVHRGDVEHPGAGVQVQLVDRSGKVVKETRTAYDGFYDFTLIVPGEYEVRVSPEQLRRLNLTAAPSRRVQIAASGTILDGIDIRLDEGPAPGGN